MGSRDDDYYKRTYGSADVATLLGKNKFPGGTTLDLYLNKVGYTTEPTERMKLGLQFEKPILDYWFKHYFINMLHGETRAVSYNNKDISLNQPNDVLRATPDAFIYNFAKGKITHIIDIKNMDKYYLKSWQESIPEYYQIQAQLYMSILNVNEFLFVCCFGGNEIHEFEMRRDGRTFNVNEARQLCKKFDKKYVQLENPPMEDHEHPHYGKALARFYGEDYIDKTSWEKDKIALSKEQGGLLDRSKRLLKTHEKNYNSVRQQIANQMLLEGIYEAELEGSKSYHKAILKESPHKGYYIILK